MIDEIILIQEIFRLKKLKSDWINIQSYENAANTRDLEREKERELMTIKNFISVNATNNEVIEKFREYFQINFGISYPNNLRTESEKLKYENFIKQLIRQEKLNRLGI